jgi:hypothetical protein
MLIAPLISGVLLDNVGLDTGGYIAVVVYSICLVTAGVLGLFLRETRGANIELNIDIGG